MKKVLFSLALACFGLAVHSNAQTIMSQTFGAPAVAPALPATWSQNSTGTGPSGAGAAWYTSSAAGTTWASLTDAYNIPAHGQYVVVDDHAYPTQLHDTLKSVVFSLTGYTAADVWMAYDYFFYNATNNSSGITETCVVLASSNGGATWAIIDSVYGNAWNGSWSTAHVSLASLSGTNCMIGFAYSDNGGEIIGCALANVLVSVPPADSVTLTAVLPVQPLNYAQTGASAAFQGTLYNLGYSTITSFTAGYQVGSATAVSNTFTGVSVTPFTSYNFTFTTPYTVLSGNQPVTIWVGETGATLTSADTMTTSISGVDSLQPKTVMIEEFNQASCDPCADAAPNVDSVYDNNINISSMVRYHVWFPGRDCMDSVTYTPFVQPRASYYSVEGVPDAQVDGYYFYPGYDPPNCLSSAVVQELNALGSPFKITFTSAAYNPTKPDSTFYTFSATIKSYLALPAGLTAYAALTVDTITYAANQSTESIPQYMFPQVAENMFPSSSGTSLAAFTDGSIQTVSSVWVKNHPWASDRAVWSYDSSLKGHIVIWVQDNTSKFVYQSASIVVPTIYATTGVTAVTTENGSMDVFPNPASKSATVALTLNTAATVQMQVYNLLGQLVYSMPAEQRNQGTSISTIDVSNFASGEYFVKVLIGNEMLTKTLTVTK